MTFGAALDMARISFTVTFSPREGDRHRPPARPAEAQRPVEPTEALGYEDRPGGEPETRPLRPDDGI